MSATSSRAFGVGAADKRMLPLVDMMNHSFTPSARVALRRKGDSVASASASAGGCASASSSGSPDGGAATEDGVGMQSAFQEDTLIVQTTRAVKYVWFCHSQFFVPPSASVLSHIVAPL
jgi:hypothetical protein